MEVVDAAAPDPNHGRLIEPALSLALAPSGLLHDGEVGHVAPEADRPLHAAWQAVEAHEHLGDALQLSLRALVLAARGRAAAPAWLRPARGGRPGAVPWPGQRAVALGVRPTFPGRAGPPQAPARSLGWRRAGPHLGLPVTVPAVVEGLTLAVLWPLVLRRAPVRQLELAGTVAGWRAVAAGRCVTHRRCLPTHCQRWRGGRGWHRGRRHLAGRHSFGRRPLGRAGQLARVEAAQLEAKPGCGHRAGSGGGTEAGDGRFRPDTGQAPQVKGLLLGPRSVRKVLRADDARHLGSLHHLRGTRVARAAAELGCLGTWRAHQAGGPPAVGGRPGAALRRGQGPEETARRRPPGRAAAWSRGADGQAPRELPRGRERVRAKLLVVLLREQHCRGAADGARLPAH
mmetsp:Transcript_32906/g.102461  ORF Transcript_32906/g.102461 Transcript_32906/m.102461 type:complete len:400 (+) Transcript_32906:417-1616(+)